MVSEQSRFNSYPGAHLKSAFKNKNTASAKIHVSAHKKGAQPVGTFRI